MCVGNVQLYLLKKVMKNPGNFLHFSYIVQNSFHINEIFFHAEKKFWNFRNFSRFFRFRFLKFFWTFSIFPDIFLILSIFLDFSRIFQFFWTYLIPIFKIFPDFFRIFSWFFPYLFNFPWIFFSIFLHFC